MTLSPDLKTAWHDRVVRMSDSQLVLLAQSFRWHRAFGCGRTYPATRTIELARADVAAGKRRYISHPAIVRQSDGMAYVEKPDSVGLRFVGRVVAECGGRNGIWDNRESSGWFTDPYGDTFKDGSGLIWGEVWQLPGRKGQARFVAGYRIGGCDSGPCLDLSRVYSEDSRDLWGSDADPRNMDAAQDAARAADSMAQHAAEEEREYQTAWQAGSRYSDESDSLAAAREELKSILAERRQVKGQAAYPALCGAIKARVSALLSDIAENRQRMAELAAGDYRDLCFWPGEERLQDAFCEGADLDKFPA